MRPLKVLEIGSLVGAARGAPVSQLTIQKATRSTEAWLVMLWHAWGRGKKKKKSHPPPFLLLSADARHPWWTGNLWLLEGSINIRIKHSAEENTCTSLPFPTFMCRVNTAVSVLQGDFTAQMKAEEGCGASNRGAREPPFIVPPHSPPWMDYSGHVVTPPESKWLHKRHSDDTPLTAAGRPNTRWKVKQSCDGAARCSQSKREASPVFGTRLSVLQQREQTPWACSASAPGAGSCCIITLGVKCARRSFGVTSMENPSGKYV